MEEIGTKFIDYDSGAYQGKPVSIEIGLNGCHRVLSHKPNADGYIRKCFMVDGRKVFKLYHRYRYECVNGKIPKGFEVDHICRNRVCCNIDHLQLLSVSAHKVKTNKERYANRIEGVTFAISEGFTNEAIEKAFNVSSEYINRYRRLRKTSLPCSV